jgi:hypothetical protein
LETSHGTIYSEVPLPYSTEVSVPVVVTKGMMGGFEAGTPDTGKDFMRLVRVEGTYTTPNNIDPARVEELATSDIPDGSAPQTKILDPKWYERWYNGMQRVVYAVKASPGELRVYDSHGRVTGLVNGEVRDEIPDSYYSEDSVLILSAYDSYRYEVVGTGEGTYVLEISSIAGIDTSTFLAVDIPSTGMAIHQYMIDWAVLSQGGEGATVRIDSNEDGVFELTFTSDAVLTRNEFLGIPQVPVGGEWAPIVGLTLMPPWISLALVAVMIAVMAVALTCVRRFRRGRYQRTVNMRLRS